MNKENIANIIEDYGKISKGFQLVSKETKIRNKTSVDIYRYQCDGKLNWNNPRIIIIINDFGKIESYKNLTSSHGKKLLDPKKAKSKAIDIFNDLDSSYARGLSFIRIENQLRSFSKNGTIESFPVQWIKFAHSNGSYCWVTLAEEGKVIEIERNSYWDYIENRRKTEMWDNDDWVLAHMGLGPQLSKPHALA